MPAIIQFDYEADHERAIDVLLEEGETYSGVAQGRILVSNAAVRALQAEGIRFRVIGGEARGEGEPNAPRP